MTFWEMAVTAPAAARFRWSQMMGWAVYRRGFGALGSGSAVVAPLRLKNVAGIEIGDGTTVYEGAWLQCEHRLRSRLILGDQVYVGHNAHLHATATIRIGDNCILADGVTVLDGFHVSGHFDEIGTDGDIDIGPDVFIGAGATVLGGVTVGKGAVIGAGAVVNRDVAPGDVVGGVPARSVRRP